MTKGRRRSRRNDRDSVRKRSRYLEGVQEIDFHDYELLRKFVTEYGKIIPARLTGANPKQQRQIKRAVRRARNIGLLA
jgi:small subunit ribosomal protein S18